MAERRLLPLCLGRFFPLAAAFRLCVGANREFSGGFVSAGTYAKEIDELKQQIADYQKNWLIMTK